MENVSIIYRIDDEGNIEELATYALPAKQALKIAYLQLIMDNWNSWDYDNIHVSIRDGVRSYCILYGDNSSLYVKREAIR